MKMFRIILLILTVGIMFTGCKNRKNDGDASNRQSEIPSDWVLKIERTGCRGSCPAFRIAINSEGQVEWEGIHAVKKMGNYVKEISTDKVKELHAVLVKYDFWELEEVYGGGVADLPSTITTLTVNDDTKRVQNIRNAPPEVTEMQQTLETILGEDGYEPAQ